MPILFDLDDTLLDDRGAQEVYLSRLLELYAGELVYDSKTAFHMAWRAAIERHFARYLSGDITLAEQRRARIRDVFCQPTMIDARADEIVAEFLLAYEAAWRLFPDVVQCLDALQEATLGVITNGNEDQQIGKLRATGILDRFSIVVVSESVGHAKPQREIFEHACSRLGCTAHECVFVGDDWARDVEGAAAVGMTPIWLDRLGAGAPRDGVLVINSLGQLTQTPPVRDAVLSA